MSISARSISGIKYVDAAQLYQWLKSGETSLSQPFQVIDVRGSDYVAGHIKGCWNYPYKRLASDDTFMRQLIERLYQACKDADSDSINVVFHCAQSQQRGPAAAMKLLRELSDNELDNFNVCVLRGGFNHWQDVYGDDSTVTEDYQPDIWSW
ncbi:hypothetical protein HG535_0B00560 [Zygotorulaspora mrakii]|uniref:Rhodanese domain-containing protein n=1 Tax=Zygotorulaspora mrakii TaxID=42260 RepID=A0A7H9AX76_ZYGMR|nr:uncharacterized protein HG535_0B00560 [Zygotorulaspora mrakii]QLG71018.1 hypothetical protein HG535_0B00560 [Zygotorulaspora mrakii]